MTSDPSPQNPGALPEWARQMVALYGSRAVNQFVLHGNVNDRLYLPLGAQAQLGSLRDFLLRVLLPRFQVILSYDLGNGIRVEKGGEIFSQWPGSKETAEWPRQPRPAVEFLTRYFRYTANLGRLGAPTQQIACFIGGSHLLAPNLPGALNYDLAALALLLREWASDDLLVNHTLVTCLIADNLNDLHPLVALNPRVGTLEIPQPTVLELQGTLAQAESTYPLALAAFQGKSAELAAQMAGVSIHALEEMLKLKQHAGDAISPSDLVVLKKTLVEKDGAGLIEFVESKRTLDDLHGQEKLKLWLRQDVVLWRQSRLEALPMGYLICGPVGTGKTYLVECLAGEAGVPVVKIKNFRDKWVGTTEGNLEKIFRLLHALGRCYVFIDEADQALGRRDSGGGDGGLSGRVYSMMAKEMSDERNRGRIIWVLASSRPDLIEVDLKRPGRVDVKIPIFPTSTTREGFGLLRSLCARRGVQLGEDDFATLEPLIPLWLTPGAAEALAVKTLRTTLTEPITGLESLRRHLTNYQPPVDPGIIEQQIRIAIAEASDFDFVPEAFRAYGTPR